MSLNARFDEPTPREEPMPVISCKNCGEGLYQGESAVRYNDETYCDDCGKDELMNEFGVEIFKEYYE